MKTNFSRVMATMALRFRDNLAVVNVERDRRYTYAEYHRLTNRIAHMMRHALGLGAGDKVLLILENDNLSLLHFPAIYKQEATFVFSNLRDSPEEQARQIDHVKPKLVFIETRLVASYRDMLAGRGCRVVAMDRSPDLPRRRAVLLGPGGSGIRRGQRCRARRARAYRHPALHRRHHGARQVRDVFDRPFHGDARQLLSHHRSCVRRGHEIPGVHADVARQPDAVRRDVLLRRRDLHAEHAGSHPVVRDRAARAHHAIADGADAAVSAARHEQQQDLRPVVAAHDDLRRGADRAGRGGTPGGGVRADLRAALRGERIHHVRLGAAQARASLRHRGGARPARLRRPRLRGGGAGDRRPRRQRRCLPGRPARSGCARGRRSAAITTIPRPPRRSSRTATGSQAMSAMSTTTAICSSSIARRT